MKQAITVAVFFLCVSAVMAGSVAGEWDFKAKSSDGQVFDLTLVLKEVGGKLSGTLGSYDGNVPLENIKMEQDKLIFELTTPDVITYTATIVVKDDSMEGTYKGDDGSSGTITAKRAK